MQRLWFYAVGGEKKNNNKKKKHIALQSWNTGSYRLAFQILLDLIIKMADAIHTAAELLPNRSLTYVW